MMFKSLKDHIDLYIQEKVDSAVKERLGHDTKTMVLEEARNFMTEQLHVILHDMIQDGVKQALASLIDEFELGEYVAETNYVPEVVDTGNATRKLLALIQHYQNVHGSESKPPASFMHENLGMTDMTISRLYKELEDGGFIERTTKTLKIKKLLQDPNIYVKNPFDT